MRIVGLVTAGVLVALVSGCSSGPSSTVTDEDRVQNCVEYSLDISPPDDGWSAAVKQQYKEQTTRLCEKQIADDKDAFSNR